MPIDNLYVERIVNQNGAFEGGGILPPPRRGQRLVGPTNVRVLRNESIIGGAKLTIAWIDDGAAVGNNALFDINVYSGKNFGLFSSSQNINNSDISKPNPLQTVAKIQKSPAELTVYTEIATPVTVVVTLRHSSGVRSLQDFASACTAFIRPLGSHVVRTTATAYTMSKTRGQILLVDASSNCTVTLPPISEVIDGFDQTVKQITASAITTTLTPVASATIDGGATAVINSRYGSVTYYAERANNVWWIKSRLP